MRLIPHPWNTHNSHSHTSPLMKTPPHQKVQNRYWNYLKTDLRFDAFDVLLEEVIIIISKVPECPQESIQEESEQALMKG